MTAEPRAFDAFIEMLHLERALIRDGDFDALAALQERKEQMTAQLAGVAPGLLQKAKQEADRNQRLLGAALKGVQAAQRRLQTILSASKGFTTYDPRGRSSAIATPSSSVEKRA